MATRRSQKDVVALQRFSESLVGKLSPRLLPADIRRVIACLEDERIDVAGASLATRQAIDRALRGLPDLRLASLESLDRPTKDLLIAYLIHDSLKDPMIEGWLTDLRVSLLREVLATADAETLPQFALDLIAALAVFCFGNEYVFAESTDETAAVDRLDVGGLPVHAALFACYRRLDASPQADVLLARKPPSAVFARLLAVQISAPREERRLKTEIRTLSSITDTTSRAVQEMYEENPYPRWMRCPVVLGPPPKAQPRRILVAGCGSGQDPLAVAKYMPGTQVIGLDLSLTSLAYGFRKAREYGLKNVEFVHGDILNVRALGLSFDHIDSFGALHHMRNPLDGLRALTEVLDPGGVIQLGLYSESGRKAPIAARALRERLGLPPTADGIRRLRDAIRRLPPNDPAAGLTKPEDFYSISGCRDLAFHVMEHRLTLREIDALLREVGLTFERMRLSPDIRARARARFPNETGVSLSDWAAFEDDNPGVFGSLYTLAASKPRE